jgi:hypothetical protein
MYTKVLLTVIMNSKKKIGTYVTNYILDFSVHSFSEKDIN